MNDFIYDSKEKQKCWYKSICDGSRCGETFCIRHYKMSCLTYMALMEGVLKYPPKLSVDAENGDGKAFSELKKIQSNVNDFVTKGKNLLIYSKNTGNGKTTWASKIGLSWLDSIWSTTELKCRALFISLPKLMAAMKDNISKPNEYFQYVSENIVDADLVIWDEINHKEYSGFEHDFLLNVISQRLTLGKSNIYTTNYGLEEIDAKLGTRLGSRVVNASIKVELIGRDRREEIN